MPHIATDDGIRLYYDEAGSGTPIVFVHEFAGDHRSYEGPALFNRPCDDFFHQVDAGRWPARRVPPRRAP